MSQPPPYDRQFNFQNQQLQTPADPLPADEIDSEYNAIKLTLDATLANLALIQRDDGQLANESVGEDQLKPELALLGNAAADVLAAATEVEADRAAAEASQNAAAASAATASGAASAAAAAKTAAETAETNAETAETNAELAEINAAASAIDSAASAARLAGTSTTSLAIGTGSKVFTTQAGKLFDAGNWLLITSNAAPATDYMHGVVTAYSGTTLTVDVTNIGGSGTHADWDIRVSGTQGPLGSTGATGAPGAPGASGAPGIQFNFASSTTDSDPGDGNFRFNNADPALATTIYVDNKEITGTDVSAWLDTFDDAGDAAGRGNLQIIDPNDTARFRIMAVTGSIVDGTGYRKISVTSVAGAGTFTVAAPASFAFFRRGPTGATGPAGGGDVTAAVAFATDERVLRSDGTGKGAQASTVALTDAGAMSGLTTLSMNGALSGVTTLITSGVATIGATAATAVKMDPSGFVELPEVSAPATPASGFLRIYAKTDSKFYRKNDAGEEVGLGAGGATNVDRQNFALSLIYQSKFFAGYRRIIHLLADGFKASDGVNAGSSSNYAIDTTNGRVAPTQSGTTVTINSASTTAAFQTYTMIDRTTAVLNSVTVATIGVYATTARNYIVKILLRNSAGNYTAVVSQTFAHGGAGWQDFTITTPYAVPGSGTYYLGAYVAAGGANPDVTGTVSRAYIASDVTGTVGGLTEDSTNAAFPMRYTHTVTAANMTVVSTAQTSDAAVTKARALVEYNPVVAITLNTDLTIELTCNGGTDWTAATLSAVGAGQAGRLVAETAETTCTSGTSFQYRLKNLNTKDVQVYGMTVQVSA